MKCRFEPIELEANFTNCIQFREDAYCCSFGTSEGYIDTIGKNGEIYHSKLLSRLGSPEWGYFHLWCGDELIGQLEFKSHSEISGYGYIPLIYLIPNYRGLGLSDMIHRFLIEQLKLMGCIGGVLSVSRTNKRAVRYYQKNGWQYWKPNDKHQLTDFFTIKFLV
ncbi:GNAT family N-acetyltransferase [Vibrio sp. PP-XX7]